ncbi:hypothetical protein [Rhodococcoides fascians]|uniref:hypothetical protein n=1 Tax=Rhodococcoides fascians TaxID=1828 RepID=UPI00378DA3D0
MTAVVIRAWDSRHQLVGHAVAEVTNGCFELPGDHPLAKAVEQDQYGISFFTILATDELQWRLISSRRTGDLVNYNIRFTSLPWISELRHSMQSDQDFLLQHGEASVQR